MTRRQELIQRIDASMRTYGDTPYGDRIRKVGVDREADMNLLVEASGLLHPDNLNLSRWRGQPEVKAAIRAARAALFDACQAAAPYVYPDLYQWEES